MSQAVSVDMTSQPEVTQLLLAFSEGDRVALDALMPAIYGELHNIAEAYLRRERAGHTLTATALVHEAFLKLIDQDRVAWQNRNHFFAIAAQAMRRILVNYARQRKSAKRGGSAPRVPLEFVEVPMAARPDELLALDEALSRLEVLNPRHARVVECRYFAGFTIEETAEILAVSARTVKRDWEVARAWLYREMRS